MLRSQAYSQRSRPETLKQRISLARPSAARVNQRLTSRPVQRHGERLAFDEDGAVRMVGPDFGHVSAQAGPRWCVSVSSASWHGALRYVACERAEIAGSGCPGPARMRGGRGSTARMHAGSVLTGSAVAWRQERRARNGGGARVPSRPSCLPDRHWRVTETGWLRARLSRAIGFCAWPRPGAGQRLPLMMAMTCRRSSGSGSAAVMVCSPAWISTVR